MAQAQVIKRGQVWWVDFGEPHRAEPGYRHPALVLQRDEINRSNLATVVVCVLTSNKALASAPGNMLLPKRATGLPRDCVANASQLATVNKTDLVELAGAVPAPLLRKISEGVGWFLNIVV